jgi:DNA-binding LacI/PurR family transcriptional regulator
MYNICLDRFPVPLYTLSHIFLAELLVPALTTLRLSLTKNEVGSIAAQMLLARIEGEAHQNPVVLSHELIIRDSAP